MGSEERQASLLMKTVVEKIVSASVGGTIVTLCMTPLDVVKARLQAGKQNTIVFKGTADAFTQIARNEGVFALWRGIMPSLAMTVPATAMYFTAYENLRDWMITTPIAPYSPLFAGVLARVITVCCTSPLELVRTSLQATEGKNNVNSLVKIMTNVVEKGGFKALWGGLPPTLIRDVPFSAIYWCGYEYFRKFYMGKYTIMKDSVFLLNFASGASAGILAAVTTNPVDVIKTRRQMNLGQVRSGTQSRKKMSEICKEVIKEEGWKGFTKGVFPRAVKTAPACAIMIASYELTKKYIQDRSANKNTQLSRKDTEADLPESTRE